MKAKTFWRMLLAGLVMTSSAMAAGLPVAAANPQMVWSFDRDWNFLAADQPGAEQVNGDETNWRMVAVPHDWSIAGPFAETNLTGGAGGFLPGGVGWYRKHFPLAASLSGRRFTIQFDGVMANSDVWINGFHLGHRPNGYVSFSYDLTSHLNFDGDNVLAVRADTSAQPASRWYTGAGIYRHVRLVVTDPVHLAENGVFVSTPEITPQRATVNIQTTVENQTATPCEVTVQTTLLAPDGQIIGVTATEATLAAGGDSQSVSQTIAVPQPQLWNLADPKLYRVVSEVRAGARLVDATTTPIGLRDARFMADTGFWLNGKNFKLKGVCLHHDGGAFGAAVPLSIWEARLKTLKTLGVNAIRTAHNPPAPEFLDLCDRMGLLVMDEFFDCWTVGKTPHDYHLYFKEWSQRDERETIQRDRNHPSVILYSVGNEIHDTPDAELAKGILSGLVAVAHEADPTRPVTQGLFRPNVSHDYDNGLADLLDVVGQNYREQEILAAHEQKPTRKILGTENTHTRQQWVVLRDNPPYAGQFLWTGIDYLGEARRWPAVGHGSGLLDRTGAIRPVARIRESWWSGAPMVALARRVAANDSMPTDPGYGNEERHTQVLFADWTPSRMERHDESVEAYSNCQEVELFLNGKSLGKQALNADAMPRIWRVPFAPGRLTAVARNGGKTVAATELLTAGKPARVVLSVEQRTLASGWDNVAIVRAKITDRHGVVVPQAQDLITFSVDGSGVIAAVDNGDNASHEPFQTSSRSAYLGEAVAFVKALVADEKIRVSASAPGLSGDAISLKTVAAKNDLE